MTNRRISALMAAITVGVSLMAASAFAHHSSAPFYDPATRVEIEGKVTRFVFRNPHAFLYLDVTDESGVTAEWQVELGAPVGLRRTGWTPETLPIGMVVKVGGQAARGEDAKGMCCVRMTRADGSPIVAGGRVAEETQPPR